MITCDAAVIGGGPAGSAAAITLARAGREVVVIDKAQFPRDKCCGDGLTTDALRRLEHLGLDPLQLPSWRKIDDFWVRSPSGRSVSFPFAPGYGAFGAVARRVELDAALLGMARSAGAKIYEGHALRSACWSPDHVTLTVEGLEPVMARYAIGADGMWSTLRKSAGVAEPGYLGEWHAFRQYFSTSSPAAGDLWVWFEPDLLPGYAWSFPLSDGSVNVGFGIRRKPGEATRSMAQIWRDLLARPHVREILGADAVAEGTHKAWPIPARIQHASLSAGEGRMLFVGDAARATDPMTGEGIGQALETAQLAAEAILGAGPHRPGEVAAQYADGVKRGLRVDHRLAGTLSRAIARPAGICAAVRLAGGNEWTRRNFARWLFEDYPRAALVTPRRWRRQMFAGPAAFSWSSPDRPPPADSPPPGSDALVSPSAQEPASLPWAPFAGGRQGEYPWNVHTGGTPTMSNEAEDFKGRAKEAAGSITDNDRLKNEGKTDQASASVKDKANTVKDKAEDGVDAVKDKVAGVLNHDK